MKFNFEIAVPDGTALLGIDMTLYEVLQGISPEVTARAAELGVDEQLNLDELTIWRPE